MLLLWQEEGCLRLRRPQEAASGKRRGKVLEMAAAEVVSTLAVEARDVAVTLSQE